MAVIWKVLLSRWTMLIELLFVFGVLAIMFAWDQPESAFLLSGRRVESLGIVVSAWTSLLTLHALAHVLHSADADRQQRDATERANVETARLLISAEIEQNLELMTTYRTHAGMEPETWKQGGPKVAAEPAATASFPAVSDAMFRSNASVLASGVGLGVSSSEKIARVQRHYLYLGVTRSHAEHVQGLWNADTMKPKTFDKTFQGVQYETTSYDFYRLAPAWVDILQRAIETLFKNGNPLALVKPVSGQVVSVRPEETPAKTAAPDSKCGGVPANRSISTFSVDKPHDSQSH